VASHVAVELVFLPKNVNQDAIRHGGNVLVHCLAGAHRAGTTGCACLIYFANMDVSNAIYTAKKLRPIIDPIGQLPEFLKKLKAALDSVGFVYDPEANPYLKA
jgi:protein-tyrosine phosphatase